MCNTKSKRNGWEGSNNVCGSNNSSPRHSSSLFLSLVHSALSRARAHQSKANKHTNKFFKKKRQMKQYILQLLPLAIFSLIQGQWPLWCLGWPYQWIQDNDTHWRCCEFTAILSGCPWESMGVRSWHFNNAATREALRALSLNDICINLIHPHIYVSTPQYPYFHPYLHQGGRTWQPFVGGKNGHANLIANLQI